MLSEGCKPVDVKRMNCKHPDFKYGVNALNELDNNGLITVFCLDCGEEFKIAVVWR